MQPGPARCVGSNKKLTKSKSGLRVVPVNNTERSPFELREPVWSPDKESRECSSGMCGSVFDLLRRRHHCRRCGLVFCDRCSQSRTMLTRMLFVDPVRQCQPCAAVSNQEEDFLARSLKLLVQGAEFCVFSGDDVIGETKPTLFSTQLSPDHRLVVFSSPSGATAPEAVQLDRVDQVQVTHSNTQYAGGVCLPESVLVKYRSAGSVEQRAVTLTAGPKVADWNRSANWILALEKAMELVYEGRQPGNC